MSSKYLLGIDAGGTFTDFVLVTLEPQVCIKLHKTLSTPDAPEQAIIAGLHSLGFSDPASRCGLTIVHGSTVATNAALEGNFAKTAYLTNRGFKDVLSLGRQTRPDLYSLEFPPQREPVPSELCLETGGRLGAGGEIVEDLSNDDLEELIKDLSALGPDAVAVNLLFSFVDDKFEKQIESAISKAIPDLFVVRSSEVLPVYKEYERGIATWLNAALGPVVSRYVNKLNSHLSPTPIQIMQSSGETIAAEQAANSAVNLLLSGPAGGLNAIRYLGEQIGESSFISFDMGGTSTDVALLESRISTTQEGFIGPYPVAVPMVDMHTIGAGGGSIASIGEGGMLQVGPASAGADPGPACYGKGGRKPTVTDANLIAGHLAADSKLAGDLAMRLDLAKAAVKVLADQLELSLEATAKGILQIANQHMARALRLISVNRGHDPKDFMLVCFGGAGGLHVCELADAMQMKRAIVPVHGGVLSALGMVVADKGRQLSKTVNWVEHSADDSVIEALYKQLEGKAKTELEAEHTQEQLEQELRLERRADIRYVGQSFTLSVPWHGCEQSFTQFSQLHQQRYGYKLDVLREIVNVQVIPRLAAVKFDLPQYENSNEGNVSAKGKVLEGENGVPVYERSQLGTGQWLSGPCIVREYSATTYISEKWGAELDEFGNICLDRKQERK
ncbi:MAG: hydantoinase/oxoprolinase family protein [Pseudohongiellaceae bacterium]